MVRTKSGPTVEHPHWSFYPFGTIQQTILHRFQLWHEQERHLARNGKTLTIETWPGTGSNQVTRGHPAFRSSVSFWYQLQVLGPRRPLGTPQFVHNNFSGTSYHFSSFTVTSLMAFHKHPKSKKVNSGNTNMQMLNWCMRS